MHVKCFFGLVFQPLEPSTQSLHVHSQQGEFDFLALLVWVTFVFMDFILKLFTYLRTSLEPLQSENSALWYF